MPSSTHVALLRGINVGGKNKLPMKDLAALFEEIGCREVRTYIQSGNVVFSCASKLERVAEAVSKRIAERFGLSVPVMLRSAQEMRALPDRNPFFRDQTPIEQLHVAFLAEAPSASAASSLDPRRSPPDAFAVLGREVFLHLPNGVGKTKISNAYLDAKLGTTSTVRNWRTVTALAELASG